MPRLQNYTLMIISTFVVLTFVLVGAFFYVNRPQLVRIDTEIDSEFPADTFSHESFERLLTTYVDPSGKVDYERWHGSEEDRMALAQYLAAVSRFSPTSSPGRFSSSADGLAYWIYAYNAYVLYSVLNHWPIESVTDVRAPVEAIKGLGFFYRQRFLFGGESLSLYAVEHEEILEAYRDPRIHFILNCASESCPVIRPGLPTGDELEPALESATREFINDYRNVHVDEAGQRIVLSTIFRWYRKDFINDLRRRGITAERGVIDYIVGYAEPELAEQLGKAEQYAVEFDDYDWTLNRRDDDQN